MKKYKRTNLQKPVNQTSNLLIFFCNSGIRGGLKFEIAFLSIFTGEGGIEDE
jgi:hypothetical protein